MPERSVKNAKTEKKKILSYIGFIKKKCNYVNMNVFLLNESLLLQKHSFFSSSDDSRFFFFFLYNCYIKEVVVVVYRC